MAGGRPTKYNQEILEQAIIIYGLGATDAQAAQLLKIDVATLHRWKEKYPEFCDALKESKALLDSQVERSLLDRAKGYDYYQDKLDKNGEIRSLKHHAPPDPTSMIFWLKNRNRAKWRDKQEIDHGNITPVFNISVKQIDDKD